MKRQLLLSLGAILFYCIAQGQQLNAAEYFYDSDPGVGHGVALTVTQGDTINFSGTISAASLGNGFHFLYIRSRDVNGKWSLSERRTLFIQSVHVSTALSNAEYFYDNDPGVGNGTAISVGVGDSLLFAGTFSTALAPGFHFMYVRARSVDGVWSLTERRMFFITTPHSSANLSAAEYFIDSDPGVGNGSSLTVTGGDSILFAGAIPSGALTPGFHFLYIRSKDLQNTWSISERRMFYVNQPVVAAASLVAAEYFIGADPGAGNGTPLTVIGGDSIIFSGAIPTTVMPDGTYGLSIRVRDAADKWSLGEERDFTVSSSIGINEIPASGNSELFQNYPNPFSSYTVIDFYLQHSGDAVLFITDGYGRVVCKFEFDNADAGLHTLRFDDASLAQGYYVCKLVSGNFTGIRKMTLLK